MSYSSVDVNIWAPNGKILQKQEHVSIASIPTMVLSSKCNLHSKSSECNLHGKTNYEWSILGKGSSDPGGYFIIVSYKYSILLQEQLVVNKVLIMEL